MSKDISGDKPYMRNKICSMYAILDELLPEKPDKDTEDMLIHLMEGVFDDGKANSMTVHQAVESLKRAGTKLFKDNEGTKVMIFGSLNHFEEEYEKLEGTLEDESEFYETLSNNLNAGTNFILID